MPYWISAFVQRLRTIFGSAPSATANAEPVDAELRDAFLAELDDIITNAKAALAKLRAEPENPAHARTLSRGFHTLKGSAPLVGATALAQIGRAGEQMLQRMAERRLASPQQIAAIDKALTHLPAWKQALHHGHNTPAGTQQVIAQLQRNID